MLLTKESTCYMTNTAYHPGRRVFMNPDKIKTAFSVLFEGP